MRPGHIAFYRTRFAAAMHHYRGRIWTLFPHDEAKIRMARYT
jgi:hypothetical protein